MNIGFFDSGLGGLSILRAVARELLQYDYVFYGDTANLPYGDRTEGDIYELTKTGVRWLFDHDSALVIIACNTASAETARRLQQEFLPAEYPDRNILGVIVPTIEALNFEKPTKAVLLATKRTIESGKYQAELDMKGSGQCDLISIATPELVPLIEMHEIEQATKQAIARIQSEAGDSKVVVLGCTHYTKLKDALRTQLPNKTDRIPR
jgi:glutamate racemase